MRRIAGIALACALAASAAADAVVLKSGARLEGEILGRENGKLRIQSGGTIYTLSDRDIVSVEESEAWRGSVSAAVAKVRGGDLPRGCTDLAEASRAGASPEAIEGALRDCEQRLMLAGRLTGMESVDVRLALKDIGSRDDLSPAARFLLARVFHAADDSETALGQLIRIGGGTIREDEQMRHWTTSILRAEVRRLAQKSEFDAAIERASLLEELTGLAQSGHMPVVHLARASQARQRGDFAASLATLADDLFPVAPEIARNRAGLVLRDMEAWAATTGKYAEARTALMAISKRMPFDALASDQRLHAAEARNLLDRGRPSDAFELLDGIEEADLSDELSALKLRADYERRAHSVNQQDPLELLELGRWCAGRELLDEAVALFRRVTDSPAIQDIAIQQLKVVEDARDLRDLQRAVELYDKGMAREAAEITARLKSDGVAQRAAGAEAEKLDRVARRDMESEERRRPYLAEVAYQQAERAYYTEDYDRALDTLDMLFTQYAGTPAAERARSLAPEVLQAVELAVAEGRRDSLPNITFNVSAAQMRSAGAMRAELDALLEALDAPSGGQPPRLAP